MLMEYLLVILLLSHLWKVFQDIHSTHTLSLVDEPDLESFLIIIFHGGRISYEFIHGLISNVWNLCDNSVFVVAFYVFCPHIHVCGNVNFETALKLIDVCYLKFDLQIVNVKV